MSDKTEGSDRVIESGGEQQQQQNKGDESQASVHSANAWEKAEFDDDERKQKFLRLMGASKKERHGRFGDAKAAEEGRPDENVNRMNADLERQFVDSMQKKITGGRKKGLGFSEPEPEEQPQDLSMGKGQRSADLDQRDRDMQMRQDDRQRADRDGPGRDSRDNRDHYRDREDRQQHGEQRNPNRDRHDYRDRRENFRDRDSGHQRRSDDRSWGNPHHKDSRHCDKQESGGHQHQGASQHHHGSYQHQGLGSQPQQGGYHQFQGGSQPNQGGYGGHRVGFGQNPGQGNSSGYQPAPQNDGSSSESSRTDPTGVHSSVPPTSHAPAQSVDLRAKFQMSFVKSKD